jgi:hypothetical protein
MTTSDFQNQQGFAVNSTVNSISYPTSTTFSSTNVTQTVPRSINIIPVANGYSVAIGCQTFVFESLTNLLYRIKEYYNNPSLIEEHFIQNKKLPTILSKKNKN